MLVVLLALCLAPSLAPSTVAAHPGIDEVLSALERESATHGADPAVALGRSAALRIARDFDAALLAADAAERRGATHRDAEIARIEVYVAAGWRRSARRHLDRLLDADGDDAAAHLLRARLLMNEGEPAIAAQDYARALALAPRPRPEHFVEHRDALVAAGDAAGALAALDAGIARLGPGVSLEMPAAELAMRLGRADDALARVDGLLERNPGNPLLLARRGDILADAGRMAAARRSYEDALGALERRPHNRRSQRSTALEHQIRTALGALSPGATEEAR